MRAARYFFVFSIYYWAWLDSFSNKFKIYRVSSTTWAEVYSLNWELHSRTVPRASCRCFSSICSWFLKTIFKKIRDRGRLLRLFSYLSLITYRNTLRKNSRYFVWRISFSMIGRYWYSSFSDIFRKKSMMKTNSSPSETSWKCWNKYLMVFCLALKWSSETSVPSFYRIVFRLIASG